MKPPSSSTHSADARSTTSMPHSRSHAIPPPKFADSRERGDHHRVPVAAPAPAAPERVGLSVQRRILILHAPVVTPAEQRAVGGEERRPDRDAALGEAGPGLVQRDREHLAVGHDERIRPVRSSTICAGTLEQLDPIRVAGVDADRDPLADAVGLGVHAAPDVLVGHAPRAGAVLEVQRDEDHRHAG
jgi:hypothetical protein